MNFSFRLDGIAITVEPATIEISNDRLLIEKRASLAIVIQLVRFPKIAIKAAGNVFANLVSYKL